MDATIAVLDSGNGASGSGFFFTAKNGAVYKSVSAENKKGILKVCQKLENHLQ